MLTGPPKVSRLRFGADCRPLVPSVQRGRFPCKRVGGSAEDAEGHQRIARECLHPDTPREVLEMISFSGSGFNYRNQSGQGAGGTNNAN